MFQDKEASGSLRTNELFATEKIACYQKVYRPYNLPSHQTQDLKPVPVASQLEPFPLRITFVVHTFRG
jgi:hypothetical protein